MSFLSPYRAALRAPHARAAFLSSLTGRLAYGTVSLSLILTLTAGGRGYGLAGAVMALFGLAVVLASPLRARLVDRHGPRRALPPMAAGFAVALTAIALVPPRPGARDAAVAALAVAAGACAPPLGVVMRTLWSALAADRAALQAAYSLDRVAEELLYVTGPVLTGLVTALAAPAAGLLVSAGLAAAGTGLFLRSPAVRRWPDLVTGPQPPAPGAARSGARAAGAAWPAALAAGAAGLCLGGLGLVIAAFCQARHDPAAVAWTEAALSAGSALGGLAYGAVPWRSPARRRLALLVAGLAVLLVPAGLSPGVPALAALAALAGVLVSPALATAYVLADALAPPAARNRAGNWVSSGFNAGSASGAAACGQLAGRVPLGACLPLLAVPALLAAVSLLRRPGAGHQPPPAGSPGSAVG